MAVIQMASAGNQIHNSSLLNTTTPRGLNMWLMLSGETSITLVGKKRRSSDNGHRSATPMPPLVNMSSKPCDTVLRG